jgi:cytochrome c553
MTLRISALFLALVFAAGANASTPTGNIAAGKNKAGVCGACHGDGNKTLDASYPKLAGQYPDYLTKALHEYKSGKRKNPIMGGQAANLSDQDIADLTAYFGSLSGTVHDLSGHNR